MLNNLVLANNQNGISIFTSDTETPKIRVRHSTIIGKLFPAASGKCSDLTGIRLFSALENNDDLSGDFIFKAPVY